jgi:urocanate hydratase
VTATVYQFPRPNALANAQIAAAMNDTDIARTVARLCERMDAEDQRHDAVAKARRAVEKDLRGLDARIAVARSLEERVRLVKMRERVRDALRRIEL